MRRVWAFPEWLFGYWIWLHFFLRGLGSRGPALTDRLPSRETQQESKFAQFLSSLPEDQRRFSIFFADDVREFRVVCENSSRGYTFVLGVDMQAGYSELSELQEAVASSKLVFGGRLTLYLSGTEYCQPMMESIGVFLGQSGLHVRAFRIWWRAASAIRFAKCVSSVLLGQDSIEELVLLGNGREMGKDVFAELVTNMHTLPLLKSLDVRQLQLDEGAMEELLRPFQGPRSVLEKFRFTSISSDVQLEQISGMLATTPSLKTLLLFRGRSVDEEILLPRGISSIATTLRSNPSLETLECTILSSVELKALLDPLIPQNNVQCNTTLTNLCLGGSFEGKEGTKSLVALLGTNTTLLKLRLNFSEGSLFGNESVENVMALLKALGTNKSLTTIGFLNSKVVGGYQVLGAMMDMLLENHCIQYIDLYNTDLEDSGDLKYVHSALAKRRKMKMWNVVQGMANVKPTSGRVFLCGEPYAGKTQLRMSMKNLEEFQEQQIQSSSRRKKVWDRVKGSKPPKIPKEAKPLERTHGIEVDSVNCDGMDITIWDMAGQIDYHAFHELVMPNLSSDGSSSLFLLVCDPMEPSNPSKARSIRSIKKELKTWLRFIASNTRRSLVYRPHVSIVMTHYDRWNDAKYIKFQRRIDDVVGELNSKFHEVLEFDKDKVAMKVDGRDYSHARGVFDFIKSHLKQLLGRLPKTLSACQEVHKRVVRWNLDKLNERILRWDEFCEMMCKDVEELRDVDAEVGERRKQYVAISLNDGGHIMYNEVDGVVVTDPHWFCHSIMGEFLHQCTSEGRTYDMVSSNGIMPIDYVKRLVFSIIQDEGNVEKKFDDILNMMMKLHMCYEQDGECIMIPSTLKNVHITLSWCLCDEPRTYKYVGKRLACRDGRKTMLTAGFFTRLQVSFFQKLASKNAQDTYQLFGSVIQFINDGIEVIIEFQDGDIDILLRSHHSQATMLEFLQCFLILHVKDLQDNPTLGCAGVLLEEFILRPDCVQLLVEAKDRKNQCVGMKELEFEVVRQGTNASYNWKPCKGLGVGNCDVKTLVGDVAWKELLERRSRDLQRFQERIQQFGKRTKVDPSPRGGKKGGTSSTISWPFLPRFFRDHELHEKLDMVANLQHVALEKLDTLTQIVLELEVCIKKMQGEVFHDICSRIDDLMAFSVEIQKSQVPKLGFLCEVGKKKFLRKLVPDLEFVQLYLMCESLHGIHEVANQGGCRVSVGSLNTKRFLAMVSMGLKIATIFMKVGAHVVGGMGAMVPDLDDCLSYGALVLDTPGLLDQYQILSANLQSVPSDARKFSVIPTDDVSEAHRWLRDFLMDLQCQSRRDFYEMFRLTRVKYKGLGGKIAWLCDGCVSQHRDELDTLT